MNMFIPTQQQAKEIIAKYGSSVYVTDAMTIRKAAKSILKAFGDFDLKVFYAIKANYNPSVVSVIKEAGIYGLDTVSTNEIKLALKIGYMPEQIIFTPSNPSNEEMKYVGEKGIIQNLGSLSELKRFGEILPGQEVSIRICPKVGAGENAKVNTGVQESKFGISLEDIDDVKKIVKKYELKLIGIHSHIGSGFYEPEVFKKSVQAVTGVAKKFADIKFLDFGGGFGVHYELDKPDIDLKMFADSIKEVITDFEKDSGKKIELRIEPGKFLVSKSTVLLTQVTTIKEKGGITFVGTDAGFNNLIRPAMYDAFHHVVNISKKSAAIKNVQVVGNVCETCDVFNKGIDLVDPKEGDTLAILTAGGYGSSMSSNYNLREIIPEILIDDNKIILTKKRQSFEQIVENFVD